MNKNVKGLEKTVRIVAGAAILGQATGIYSLGFDIGILDEAVGVILLGTGVISYCPIKSLLGGLGSKKAPARSTTAKKPAKRKAARKATAKKPAKRKRLQK
ncbi:MAG: DUF2892 domain-containing protein [Candidatus Methylopumilus sp.]|nr:DUF2892 domain-containing protein [Candidatus Methylopumilus sp.]